ncbi:cbb3-type cytochrome c oxidase N-terminal domain-containing protein [Robertkochia solimangrovi]|uniref:cbb3-type cytochrome c oxidase N-terminal domain-containing protein n=1 Tax=Robertkochia solimangrovi TaxID=2213046 RepID=UPI00117C6760|nr:cbb3-type cytochrome c oxidase N-terminal domain-containing protein [Robertkochia solimangrovi]TRZ46192.1 cytochrome C oxidase subunit III [Robertkochia solimangrovi]
MKDFSSYLRVMLIVGLVVIGAEYLIDSGNKPAFIEYPEVLLFIVLFTITLIGIEVMLNAMNNISEAMMTEEQKAIWEARKKAKSANVWYKKLYRKMTASTPIEEEGEIILDHNYDGIRELDNSLPPWWLYGFYVSILFAAIYLVRFEIMGGQNQFEEYDTEMANAKIAIEEYKKTAKDLVDVNTVTLLTDASDLSKGETIFQTNCIACHMQDGGGGIGPNLTDAYWILGGGIKNVFHTISEGGRDGKGMIAWKATLKPSEIAQVASYVLSLQGTTPANPKEPQGDIWEDPDAPAVTVEGETAAEEPETTVTDSVSVESN